MNNTEITVNPPAQTVAGVVNQFQVKFTPVSTTSTLKFPDNVKWWYDYYPSFQLNHVYLFSFEYVNGVWMGQHLEGNLTSV